MKSFGPAVPVPDKKFRDMEHFDNVLCVSTNKNYIFFSMHRLSYVDVQTLKV